MNHWLATWQGFAEGCHDELSNFHVTSMIHTMTLGLAWETLRVMASLSSSGWAWMKLNASPNPPVAGSGAARRHRFTTANKRQCVRDVNQDF